MKGLLTTFGCMRVGKAKKYMPWTQKYALTKRLMYTSKIAAAIITVPKGFVTNFATWIKPRGSYEIPAVIHDYLYSKEGKERYGLNRHQADRVFNEAMHRAGCSQFRINVMYYGVRLFGWWTYHFGE
jgi:hypothetical protein